MSDALDLITRAVADAFPEDRADGMLDAIERAFRMSHRGSAVARPCAMCGGSSLPRFPLLRPVAGSAGWSFIRPVVPEPSWGGDAPGVLVACFDCLVLAREEHGASPPSESADRLLADALRAVRATNADGAASAAAALEAAFSRAGAPVLSRQYHPGCAICSETRPCAQGGAGAALCEDCSRDHFAATVTDPLTGALSRAPFSFRLESALARAKRLKRPLSILMLDVDFMKSWNDIHGLMVGDALLTRLPGIMRSALREEDLVARWGGEELIAMLPGRTLADAREIGERIRARAFEALRPPDVEVLEYERARVDLAGRPHFPDGRVTVSIGIAAVSEDTLLLDLLRRADERVQDAKLAGRNRVVS